MKWNQEKMQWTIIHYSHNFDDFNRMIGLYPESAGYAHMINIDYIKSHAIMQQLAAYRERQKASQQ